jgi:hypothetical protein
MGKYYSTWQINVVHKNRVNIKIRTVTKELSDFISEQILNIALEYKTLSMTDPSVH